MKEVSGKTIEIKKGQSSRTRKVLIEQAIALCPKEDRYNRYIICEKLCELMEARYSGQNLEYHSERMGMATTRQMLREIDTYFYRLNSDFGALHAIECQ